MIDWKNVMERAAWTFLEAFLVALPATISADSSLSRFVFRPSHSTT